MDPNVHIKQANTLQRRNPNYTTMLTRTIGTITGTKKTTTKFSEKLKKLKNRKTKK